MTHALVEVQTPSSPQQARVDRFLARVAALTPREWGELDAMTQRLEARDPIGWWQRGRIISAVTEGVPVINEFLSIAGFFVSASIDLSLVFERYRPRDRNATAVATVELSPELRPLVRAHETLTDIARAQPLGVTNTSFYLGFALSALWFKDKFSAAAFTRMYAPVQPVIPAESL